MYIETTLWPLYDMYFVLFLYGCVRWHYFLKIWLNQKHWNCIYLCPWLPPLDTITPRIFLCILKLDCVHFRVGILSCPIWMRKMALLPQNMAKLKTLKLCIFVSMVTALVYNNPKNIIDYIETRLCPLYGRYSVLFLYGCVRWHYFLKIWLN